MRLRPEQREELIGHLNLCGSSEGDVVEYPDLLEAAYDYLNKLVVAEKVDIFDFAQGFVNAYLAMR